MRKCVQTLEWYCGHIVPRCKWNPSKVSKPAASSPPLSSPPPLSFPVGGTEARGKEARKKESRNCKVGNNKSGSMSHMQFVVQREFLREAPFPLRGPQTTGA